MRAGFNADSASGGNKDFVFGKNELGLHLLHDWIDYYVNACAERPFGHGRRSSSQWF